VTSDQSDLENRIQALTEQLKKCKAEAENLRREQRRQRKMKLKAEEEALKQQIEVNVWVGSFMQHKSVVAAWNIPVGKSPRRNVLSRC
jgi:phage-related minor tail protein